MHGISERESSFTESRPLKRPTRGMYLLATAERAHVPLAMSIGHSDALRVSHTDRTPQTRWPLCGTPVSERYLPVVVRERHARRAGLLCGV